ncbi:MAG: hypothetical protein ABIO83_01390 [Ilumatobacteraceae bacterium]
MIRVSAGAMTLATVLTLGACGTTYIDTEVTVPDTSPGLTVPTLPAVDPDTPTADLLAQIETLMFDLDQRIIDEHGQVPTLQRINEIWAVAERQIGDVDPDALFNFRQAINLARSGVQRRRPADASKGYKIFAEVTDAYDG